MEIWARVPGYSNYECNKSGDIIVRSRKRVKRAQQGSTQKVKAHVLKLQGLKYRLVNAVNGSPRLFAPENVRAATYYGAELVPASRKVRAI